MERNFVDSDTRSARDPRGGNDTRAERKARIGSPRATRGRPARQRRECPVPALAEGRLSVGRWILLYPRTRLARVSSISLLYPRARSLGAPVSLRHVSMSFRTTPSRRARGGRARRDWRPYAWRARASRLRLSSHRIFRAAWGERPTIARTPVRAAVARSPSSATRGEARERGRKQSLGTKTTLSQAWSGNCIRGPQCAFEMSMFMCPAVHKLTRN
ncbi:hypothetical protein P5V15_015241 [Pogonomyrmex californicus]